MLCLRMQFYKLKVRFEHLRARTVTSQETDKLCETSIFLFAGGHLSTVQYIWFWILSDILQRRLYFVDEAFAKIPESNTRKMAKSLYKVHQRNSGIRKQGNDVHFWNMTESY